MNLELSQTSIRTLTDKIPLEETEKRIKEVAGNAWSRCVGLTLVSDKFVRSKVKEYECKESKKAFGVRYMDLVLSGADDEELQQCLKDAKAEAISFNNRIDELKKEMGEFGKEKGGDLVKKGDETASEVL